MDRILVATDGSETAGRAVDVAADLAKATGAKLFVLTVDDERRLPAAEVNQLASTRGDVPVMVDVPAMRDEFAGETAKQAESRARRLGAQAVETEVRWGDAAGSSIEAAKDRGVDTIVVGRRGRGRLAGLLVGSVSQKVVALAPSHVVVVS